MLIGPMTADSAFARGARVINNGDRTVLSGNVHPLAREEFDVGAADISLPMEQMVIALRLSPAKQAELDRFLAAQQDPASADFHHWLTPEEFGGRFGAAPEDVAAVTDWLTSQGFTVHEVGKGRTWVNFSGAISDVERAFRTQIRDYNINGKIRHANAVNPSIPLGLADLVGGVVSLHNFPRKPMNTGIRTLTQEDLLPQYNSGGSHYMSPGDFAAIYNLAPLYNSGIDGTGQSIAIVGRTHPSSANWDTFRSKMGLSANSVQVIVNGTDPGDLGSIEDGEADLDVEWSGAVAKNATVTFVVSKSTNTTDGIDLSAAYIIDNNLAPVMSVSFGSCEAQMGTLENQHLNTLWSQAASQGITVFVSSGDSGAAGCSSASAPSGSGQGVNGLASTPYNVAVGGTQFNEGSGSYWNSSNSGYSSAIGYIPEIAWNESGVGSGLWASGGGVSTVYAKPSWQVSPGVPADGKRDVPDVSLSAAGHDAYLVQTQGTLHAVGGTSAASPSFAGLMALIVQKTGQRQGNANARFYQLASAQYGLAGAAVFHDTVSGDNTVPGVSGYSSGVGYDLVTGLGSVDAMALVNNWTAAVSQIVNGACGSSNGQTLASAPTTGFCSAGSASSVSGSGPWNWSCAGSGGGSTASCSAGIQTHTVTPLAGAGGSISPSSPQAVVHNGTVSFIVTPASGYSIASVSGCGGVLSGSNYTTGAVTGDCAVIAIFTQEIWAVKSSTLSVGYKAAKGTIAAAVASTVSSTTITASTDASWITLSGSGATVAVKKGKGSGKISYQILANPSSEPRTGTITVNGQEITVTQAGAPCVVSSILPAKGTFSADGGDLYFVVIAPDACNWTVAVPAASADWLTSDTLLGSGVGVITLTADANIGGINAKGVYVKAKSKKASIMIQTITDHPARKTISVSQNGA